jgi:transposase-like protein
VHKHRNLLAHAPERLHDEVTADYTDMIDAATAKEIETRRKAFIRKWRLRHRPVADCLEEAGDRLFTFTGLPKRENNERDRTSARRVQAADQDADRAAIGRYGGDVVLGAARVRSDQYAQG